MIVLDCLIYHCRVVSYCTAYYSIIVVSNFYLLCVYSLNDSIDLLSHKMALSIFISKTNSDCSAFRDHHCCMYIIPCILAICSDIQNTRYTFLSGVRT